MKIIFTAFILLTCIFPACSGQEIIPLRASIHISSTISDGEYSPREIVAAANEKGISVVAITDKASARWELGLWPLRNILKKTIVNNSILRYGAQNYLDTIRQLQSEFPQMIILAGLDAAPFYYWSGSLFKGNLTINNWHKHIVAIGLPDADDYRYLPVIGNTKGLRTTFNPGSLWPLLLFIAGVHLLRRRKYNYKDYQGRVCSPCAKGWRACGAFLILAAAFFLINNFPFLHTVFDQYHGDAASFPYQNFIDYINERQGITIWTHPEAENISKRGTVRIETFSYEDELIKTGRYTGFSLFYDGYQKCGTPGGIWDALLIDYCNGRRAHPVWAFGGLALDMRGELARELAQLQTVILAQRNDTKSVLEAMRKGKMYVAKGPDSLTFRLVSFSVQDGESGRRGVVGDTVTVTGRPRVDVAGKFDEKQQEVTVKIIREGAIKKTYTVMTPFNVSYSDPDNGAPKTYYRVEITGKNLHFVTNPVFIKKSVKRYR